MNFTKRFSPSPTALVLVPASLATVMVMGVSEILVPFVEASMVGGAFVATAIGFYNKRYGSILSIPMRKDMDESKLAFEISEDPAARSSVFSGKMSWSMAKPSSRMSPEPTSAKQFDLRAEAFELRWNHIGRYSNPSLSTEENREFRRRVHKEFKIYVEGGLDTLSLCELISKSTAFTVAERAEIIEDLLETY